MRKPSTKPSTMPVPPIRARVLGVLMALVMLGACAYQPIVDKGQPGFDAAKYEKDLAACKGYAGEVDTMAETGTAAVVSAAAGAVLGAIFGAFSGDAGGGAALGAAAGGAAGAISGAGKASSDKDAVLRNCLSGRGYAVLR